MTASGLEVPAVVAELRRRADEHLEQRRQLLTAAVAIGTTRSPAAAIRAVREHPHLPDDFKDQVVKVIGKWTAVYVD